jgi:hypothetical protein
MPLYEDAVGRMRINLELIAAGRKVRPFAIGILTERQLGAINQSRQARTDPLPVVIAEVLFIGQHIYNCRVVRDGYTIDDVLKTDRERYGCSGSLYPNLKGGGHPKPQEASRRLWETRAGYGRFRMHRQASKTGTLLRRAKGRHAPFELTAAIGKGRFAAALHGKSNDSPG